jgi:hypothetical protein
VHRITVRPRQPRDDDDEPQPSRDEPAVLRSRTRRGRVREALRCPYCHDQVEGGGAVGCARTACGAVYHLECWGELQSSYGACAVYGCGSQQAKELSRWAWWWRLTRLILATILFPPRVVGLVRQADTEGLRSIYRRAREKAGWIYGQANANSTMQTLLVLGMGVPLSYALVALVTASRGGELTENDMAWIMPLIGAGPFLMLILPSLLAFVFTVGVALATGLAHAFATELSALARADRPDGTFLERLRAGAGGKGKGDAPAD